MSQLRQPIVWIHEDCLAPDSPVLLAYPGAPALFIFDEQALRREAYSLKRIAFLYECLLELPVTIRKGDCLAELAAFAEQHRADGIVTMASVNPHLQAVLGQLRQNCAVQVLQPVPFISHPGPFDLTRFSRFWSKAERHAWGS